MPEPVESKKDRPSAAAYAAAAWLLMCEPAAIQAVAQVEAGPHGAFLDSGEPVILFERHIFDRLTEGRFRGRRISGAQIAHEVISWPEPGGYGPLALQHEKLRAAVQLDRPAALMSCSWGLFQILGRNHAQAGYPILQRFVTAMYGDVEDHMRAFVMFIRYDGRLVDSLRGKDWSTFARIYNGPNYQQSRYDERLATAYEAAAQAARAKSQEA